MARLLALTNRVVVSVAIACALSTEVLGQESGASIRQEPGAGVDTDAGTTAATGATDFGTVISAIQSSRELSQQIKNLNDVSDVRIIRVSDIANEDSAAALDNALRQKREDVEALRSAIQEKDQLSEQLQQDDVQADDVLAAVDTGGQLVVYIR